MAFNPDQCTTHAPSGGRIEPRGASGVQSVSGKAFARVRELAAPDRMGTITAVHTHHYRNRPYGGWKRSILPTAISSMWLGRSSKAKLRHTTSIRSAL